MAHKLIIGYRVVAKICHLFPCIEIVRQLCLNAYRIYNRKSRHHVRDLISNGVITIVYVKFGNNLADPFIKALSRDLVQSTSRGMGLKPMLSTNNGNLTSSW